MNYFMYTSHDDNNDDDDDDDNDNDNNNNFHFKQGNGLCNSAVLPCTNICKHSPSSFSCVWTLN